MNLQKYIPLIARIFIAVIFIHTGILKVFGFSGTQEQIASAGIPIAGIVTVFTILFEIIGGISLTIGYQAQIGSILLLIFLVPATLVFHNPIGSPSEVIPFMKNLAIAGGLLLIVAFGAGPVSIDQRMGANHNSQ